MGKKSRPHTRYNTFQNALSLQAGRGAFQSTNRRPKTDDTTVRLILITGEEAMHIHGPSHLHGPQSIGAPHGAKPVQPARPQEAPQIADEVDISEAARMAEQIQQMPDVRGDRVEAVRRQIAEGTYETRDKLNVAVERLLDEIG